MRCHSKISEICVRRHWAHLARHGCPVLFCLTAAWIVDFSSSFLASASLTQRPHRRDLCCGVKRGQAWQAPCVILSKSWPKSSIVFDYECILFDFFLFDCGSQLWLYNHRNVLQKHPLWALPESPSLASTTRRQNRRTVRPSSPEEWHRSRSPRRGRASVDSQRLPWMPAGAPALDSHPIHWGGVPKIGILSITGFIPSLLSVKCSWMCLFLLFLLLSWLCLGWKLGGVLTS